VRRPETVQDWTDSFTETFGYSLKVIVEKVAVSIECHCRGRMAEHALHCLHALGRTSRVGVWAAGDVATRADPRIPAAVVTAMASGLTAANDIAASVAIARDLQKS
jgi:thioredoxin reductase